MWLHANTQELIVLPSEHEFQHNGTEATNSPNAVIFFVAAWKLIRQLIHARITMYEQFSEHIGTSGSVAVVKHDRVAANIVKRHSTSADALLINLLANPILTIKSGNLSACFGHDKGITRGF
jgi:hypothetical protein